jgi:hypothetical protein
MVLRNFVYKLHPIDRPEGLGEKVGQRKALIDEKPSGGSVYGEWSTWSCSLTQIKMTMGNMHGRLKYPAGG